MMRSRSNSGNRLDYFYRLLQNTILCNQCPVSGLFHSQTSNFVDHAWVRDNVYVVHSIWALMLAYRKRADFDEDRVRVYQLEQTCVKVMRGLLMCMMRQVEKVELFKHSQLPKDALHAKYSVKTGATVCGDFDWGHLQIDATSLYLLTLAQLTASGLQIVYTLDEVTFVQNLVFYIETAYRVPDFGIWERGDKTNQGIAELNASSVGLAKAALQALNDLDLFGARGSASSVIHVMADEMEQCKAVLQSMLPRESNSKEVDAALLSVIGYPAFAVEDSELIEATRSKILSRLAGPYGCRRFLRDGYKCPLEDPSRLYYEPWELQKFENIECQWPLFFCYLVLDGLFLNKPDQVREYRDRLEGIMVKTDTGLKVLPELYAVPRDKVSLEVEKPGSQIRVPAGTVPYIWGQALYILGCLIEENFIQPAEIDPLNRRLCMEKRPDIVVQVVVLAETDDVQTKLNQAGIHVQTVDEVDPYVIQPASVLGKLYSQLGRCEKLKLTGRTSRDVGLLSTSQLYHLGDRVCAFTPQFMDWKRFYTTHDLSILLDVLKSELFYVKSSWNVPGRPLIVLCFSRSFACPSEGKGISPGIISTLKKMRSGYLGGTRIVMGKIQDFITTSCVTRLTFLESTVRKELDPKVLLFMQNLFRPVRFSISTTENLPHLGKFKAMARKVSSYHRDKMRHVSTLSKRRKTMVLQTDDLELEALRLRCSVPTSPSLGPSAHDSPISSVFSSVPQTPPADGTPRAVSPIQEDTPVATPTDSRKVSEIFTSSDLSAVVSTHDMGSLDAVAVDELIDMLQETGDIEEQADIIYCLWLKKGLDFNTGIRTGHFDALSDGKGVTVKQLLEELYEKACRDHVWWLVRHTAGLLDKKVDDLPKAVTDLLVRGKQLTVGIPSVREEAITKPLPPDELQHLIKNVFRTDFNSAVLTQEILLYLDMFVRTEPNLFLEMLRLRIGLIIQVMASELARVLHCTGDAASQHLLNLSPFEVKTLLHHILSGKEFGATHGEKVTMDNMIIREAKSKVERSGILELRKQIVAKKSAPNIDTGPSAPEADDEPIGHWLRRRRIDGALNRVPPEFYQKMWDVLKKCESLNVESHIMDQNLTKEMTRGELKFALTVESVLNQIPEPEYRQLMVEALMVLGMIAAVHTSLVLGPGQVKVRDIVHLANVLFIEDQREQHGDAILCCAKDPPSKCVGYAGLCVHFVDSAPSGRFGTLTYMCRAVAQLFHQSNEDIECIIS